MDPVAIIASSVDVAQIARALATVHIEWQDGERKLETSEKKIESLRDDQRRRAMEMGKLLVQAKSAIKHGGWLPYLAKLGIEERSARRWMELADCIEESKSDSNDDESDLPSQRKVAAARKSSPRVESDEDEPDDDVPEQSPIASWKNDLDRALRGIDKMIMGYATSWPQRSRKSLAQTLRSIANRIEQLGND